VPFVRCEAEALPFETDSLDVVIVHHVLEFSANPHALLRELHRVTVPHGRILLLGFNPWSMFGLRMAAGQFRGDSLWRNHLLSAPRVTDWLQLLGFDSDRVDFGFHRPPLQRAARWFDGESERPWTRHWPMGSVYLITAVKQVAKFTPIRPRWARTPALVPLPVAKPSVSAGQSSSAGLGKGGLKIARVNKGPAEKRLPAMVPSTQGPDKNTTKRQE
jgi:SAM-dependent methyltransferase